MATCFEAQAALLMEHAQQLRGTVGASLPLTDGTKKRKRQQCKSDPNRPKPGANSAYLLFIQEEYHALKQKGGSEVKGTSIVAVLAQQWRSMDAQARAPYNAKAEVVRETYKTKLNEYNIHMSDGVGTAIPGVASSSSSSSSSASSSSSSKVVPSNSAPSSPASQSSSDSEVSALAVGDRVRAKAHTSSAGKQYSDEGASTFICMYVCMYVCTCHAYIIANNVNAYA